MTRFFMYGKYTVDGIKQISKSRTGEVTKILKQCGGEIFDGFATLGDKDLCLIVDLPDLKSAMRASVLLTRATGIGFSCVPAITFEEFDNLVA